MPARRWRFQLRKLGGLGRDGRPQPFAIQRLPLLSGQASEPRRSVGIHAALYQRAERPRPPAQVRSHEPVERQPEPRHRRA